MKASFARVRLVAASMLTEIGSKHSEVRHIADTAAFMCRDLNYEGAEEILVECLNLADEEYEDIADLKEALHDPICLTSNTLPS